MTMTVNTSHEIVQKNLPGIPLDDPNLIIKWDEIKAEPKCTESKCSFITTIVCGKICKAMEWDKVEARPPLLNVSLFFQIMKRQENDDLKMLSRWAYLLHIEEYPESFEQLSNELLQCSFACMADVKQLGMIKSESFEGFFVNPSYHYQFLHPIIQEYLAAYYLINQPLMTVLKFVNSKLFSLDQNKWGILEMYFGLAGAGLSKIAKEALFYMLSYICQSFNGSHPIVSNQKALLIMRCLNEAQDNNLCLQVHHELFRSQIFSFSIDEIESSINGVAYYLVSSAQDNATWKIYCSKERLIGKLKSRIHKCTDIRKRKTLVVIIIEDHDLMFGDVNRVVISLQSRDFVFTTLSEHISYGERDTHFDSQAIEVTSESSVIVTADRVTRPSMPVVSSDPSELSLVPYGHQTTEQYRTQRQVENVTFYNMVKDLVSPQLQMYCPILVQTQYRKSDHIWFSFSRNMRYDFYEGVLITPIVPMHWVKVSVACFEMILTIYKYLLTLAHN